MSLISLRAFLSAPSGRSKPHIMPEIWVHAVEMDTKNAIIAPNLTQAEVC